MNNEGCARALWLTESYAFLKSINNHRADGDILVLSTSIIEEKEVGRHSLYRSCSATFS